MNEATALIVSLRFNPGHFSHLVANFRLLEDLGFKACLFVNAAFNEMDEVNSFRKINKASELRGVMPVSLAIFWFPSSRNIVEIIRLRLTFRGIRILYVFHEPFESIRAYRKSGFSWLKVAKIVLVSITNLPVLFLSHGVILPSRLAFATYQKKYASINPRCWCLPLPFDDEAAPEDVDVQAKGFFSYIGTIAADHAFDRFVAFVEAAISNRWLANLKFLIATRNVVPTRERMILERLTASGRLVLHEGVPMSNAEINHHYRHSLVVWNAYNRSMQSGVLPKAYMFGSPVIALRPNANEFFDDHKTGLLVDDNADLNAIRAAVEEIDRQRAVFMRHCQQRFLTTFYYRSMTATFGRMLHALGAL